MAKWVRHIVFLLMLIIIMLPLIQQNTGFINVKPLRGSGAPPVYPLLNLGSWIDGSFQAGTDRAIEQRIGFRPLLIRIKNQLEYSFFSKANARGVIVGKKRYLFEEDYLRAYTGMDYPGDWYWTEKFRRAGLVRDTLTELGVNLAIVIEPSKASCYPEFIPDNYNQNMDITRNNYESIVKGCLDENLPVLDLYEYFSILQDEARYPLFPKGGIHWSYYGMLQAMDTILPSVQTWTGKNVPTMSFEVEKSEKKLRGTDGDLAELLNVMFMPSNPPMAYPEIEYSVVEDSLKPRVLAISDSFYFNILNADIPKNVYANSAFWYYNVEIFPESWSSRKDTSMINYREEIESMDLVMVMITERFFYKFAWSFFDKLYEIYYPAAEVDYRYYYTSRIITHYKWFDEVVAESSLKNLSVEEGLEDHSGFRFWQDDQKGILKKNQSYYEMKIRTNVGWMEQIREKAEKNGRSVDMQIKLDAEWTLNNSNK